MIRKLFVTTLVLLFASPAWSYTIPTNVDVGSIDDVVDYTSNLGCGNGSNEAAEECWAESVLGEDLVLGSKIDPVPVTPTTENHRVVAFALDSGTGHYVVKNGSGAWILMLNLANEAYGVLDLDEEISENLTLGDFLNLCSNGNSSNDTSCTSNLIISHVTPFIGGETKVPEPAPLALLGLGLLGLALTRRSAFI